MATPILKVPVDDAAFQKFLALFKRYQDALNAMPEAWKGVNAGIDEHVEKGLDATAVIEGQVKVTTQLAAEEEKRGLAQRKRAQDQDNQEKKRARERAQEEREQGERRQQAISQFRAHAETVSSFVRNIGRADVGGLVTGASQGLGGAGEALAAGGGALLGGLGGTILAGLGLTLGVGAAAVGGAYELASGAADRFRLAGGLGISTGELQGTQAYLGPAFGDTAGMMDRLMRAKYSPSQQGTLALLGINPTGKDPAQMLPESIVKARRFFLNQGKNMDVMAATGVLNLFSPEELMNSTQFSEADILGKGTRSAEWAKKYGVTKSASERMADFVSNVDAAADALKNKFVMVVDKALPTLNKLITNLNKLGDDIAKIEPFFRTLGSLLSPDFNPVQAGQAAAASEGSLLSPDFNPVQAGQAAAASEGPSWTSSLSHAYTAAQGWWDQHLPTWDSINKKGAAFLKSASNFLTGGGGASMSALEASYGLPTGTLSAIYGAESVFGTRVHDSRTGAKGPMQFMPGTWKQWGQGDVHNLADATKASARYMAHLLQLFHGDEAKALAAYNWGEGSAKRGTGVMGDVARHGARWFDFAPRETQDYVKKTLAVIALANRQKTNPKQARSAAGKVTVVVKDQGSSVSSKVNALN